MATSNQSPYDRGEGAKFLLVVIGVLFIIAAWGNKGIIAFLKMTLGVEIAKWQFFIGAIIVFWGLYKLAEYLILQSRTAQQQLREDSLLKKILAQSREGNAPPFYLYLRPFSSTGKITITDAKADADIPVFSDTNLHLAEGLETILGQAVEPDEFLGLGRPGEAIGAARIETADSQWRQMVETLASLAKGILVLPAIREGMAWEMDYLQAHPRLLKKTIFLMPPTYFSFSRLLHTEAFNLQQEWSLLHNGAMAEGVDFPAYDKNGMLFTLTPQGKVLNKATPNWARPSELGKSIRKLLASVGCGGEGLRGFMASLSCGSPNHSHHESAQLCQKIPYV
ncbi:MAG: hypothetical protein KDD02_19280 [Phaeodactylibacter sp.]|nr:hypothetical protein [Phaeodactylibacter sp.]